MVANPAPMALPIVEMNYQLCFEIKPIGYRKIIIHPA
jgi:hypothetical protein